MRNNNAQLRAVRQRHTLILLAYKKFSSKKQREKAPKTSTKLYDDNCQNSPILGSIGNLFNVGFLKLGLKPYMSRHAAGNNFLEILNLY